MVVVEDCCIGSNVWAGSLFLRVVVGRWVVVLF